MTFVFMSKLITTAHVTTPIHCHYHFKCYGFKIVGPFLYIMCWVGLPFAVMDPSMLGKGVEISPAAVQLGLVCAQTMHRLSGVCLWQAELF